MTKPMNTSQLMTAQTALAALQTAELSKITSQDRFKAVRAYAEPSPQDEELINTLFTDIKGSVPGWKQALHSPKVEIAAKRQWYKAFIDAGINRKEQLDAGLAHLRGLEQTWWPTVAEFISWCRISHGLPTSAEAYREYCRNLGDLDAASWTHPIVRAAGREAGSYEMRCLPEAKALPIYTRAYERLRSRLDAGEELDVEIPKGLPDEITGPPLSRAENKSRLQGLLGAFE